MGSAIIANDVSRFFFDVDIVLKKSFYNLVIEFSRTLDLLVFFCVPRTSKYFDFFFIRNTYAQSHK